MLSTSFGRTRQFWWLIQPSPEPWVPWLKHNGIGLWAYTPDSSIQPPILSGIWEHRILGSQMGTCWELNTLKVGCDRIHMFNDCTEIETSGLKPESSCPMLFTGESSKFGGFPMFHHNFPHVRTEVKGRSQWWWTSWRSGELPPLLGSDGGVPRETCPRRFPQQSRPRRFNHWNSWWI